MNPITEKQEAGVTIPAIFSKACCLTLDLGVIGNARKVSSRVVEADTDKTMIAVSKKLLDSNELDAIRKHDGEIRKYIYSQSLPSPLKAGTYLVPLVSIEQVEDKLKEFASVRQILIRFFVEAYDGLVEASLGRLRALGVRNDYKSQAEAANSFNFTWSWFTFGVPGSLKEVNMALFETEREKLAANIKSAEMEIRAVLRAELKGLVDKAYERLSGEKKVFRDSLLGNIEGFLSTFEARNITDDAELKAVTEKARKMLSGVSPKVLREEKGLKEVIAIEFQDMADQLDKMMIDMPLRRVEL